MFSDFLYKSICCGYSFELQMGTHNICPYKVDKKYTGCNLETTDLLDCALIGVCAVIRANMVDVQAGLGFCCLHIMNIVIT